MNKVKFWKSPTGRQLTMISTLLLVLLLGLDSGHTASRAPYLVKDINPGIGSSVPVDLEGMDGMLFIGLQDGAPETGGELWKSDGTEEGTVLVKDIRAGREGSGPLGLTMMGRAVVFGADDGIHGDELWKSDGTEEGTVQVKDINSGSGSSWPWNFTVVDDTVYFSAGDGIHGDELWKSDGTQAGTVQVADICPGSCVSWPGDLTEMDGLLFFNATDRAVGPPPWTGTGDELWKSDGTEAGTVLVKDIEPGGGGSGPRGLLAVDGVLFLTAYDSSHGRELWKSDGTEAGTVLVKDICPGTCEPFALAPDLIALDGMVFFRAWDWIHGTELWKSDGTAEGTRLLKDIRPGYASSGPHHWQTMNGEVFFIANDGIHGSELWKSDGTEAGTVLVKDINAGAGHSSLWGLTEVDGLLFFEASDGTHGEELWESDGTAAGTAQVADICPGSCDSWLADLTEVQGTLFFTANDGLHGNEPWALAVKAFSISGRITDINRSPFSGVNISDNVGHTAASDINGYYSLDELSSGTYTLTPTKSPYAFWPTSRTASVPPDAVAQDFIILPSPVTTTLTPGVATTMGYVDMQGLPTELAFPSDAVNISTTVILTPTILTGGMGLAFTGHAFELVAYQSPSRQPDTVFGAPVTVTIEYSDDDVRMVTDEDQLTLWLWAGSEWQDAAETCEPASTYVRDLVKNLMRVSICHGGLFGLFGPTNQTYLPLILYAH
ncbi:ELWxxDGT repeat protein [Chloroflexota bacterium]